MKNKFAISYNIINKKTLRTLSTSFKKLKNQLSLVLAISNPWKKLMNSCFVQNWVSHYVHRIYIFNSDAILPTWLRPAWALLAPFLNEFPLFPIIKFQTPTRKNWHLSQVYPGRLSMCYNLLTSTTKLSTSNWGQALCTRLQHSRFSTSYYFGKNRSSCMKGWVHISFREIN